MSFIDLDTPIVVVETSYITISKYRFIITDIKLNLEMSYQIFCYGSDDDIKILKTIVGKIEGPEYQAWGTDDSYIENYIRDQVLKLM